MPRTARNRCTRRKQGSPPSTQLSPFLSASSPSPTLLARRAFPARGRIDPNVSTTLLPPPLCSSFFLLSRCCAFFSASLSPWSTAQGCPLPFLLLGRVCVCARCACFSLVSPVFPPLRRGPLSAVHDTEATMQDFDPHDQAHAIAIREQLGCCLGEPRAQVSELASSRV